MKEVRLKGTGPTPWHASQVKAENSPLQERSTPIRWLDL
jgi:hypothetical protein